jgi:hypothetical protein
MAGFLRIASWPALLQLASAAYVIKVAAHHALHYHILLLSILAVGQRRFEPDLLNGACTDAVQAAFVTQQCTLHSICTD